MEIQRLIRKRAAQRILYLPHALRQMLRPERMISAADVRKVLEEGEVIEDYPDDPRGQSCLMLGRGADGRVIHVVCAPKEDYAAVITTYLPDATQWSANFKTRLSP